MSVDSDRRLAARAARQPADAARQRYDRATAELDPPLALTDGGAFDRNAADMVRRAAGHPIRVATKSLRCRYLIERCTARPRTRWRLATRVWMRHAKAGELAERFRSYHVLGEDEQVTTVPTYRGEGQCFG